MNTSIQAPIPADVRAWLARDCSSVEAIMAAARRKGSVCVRSEAIKEKHAADQHFELGCWLHYYARRVGQRENLQDRIDCVRRCFEAGVTRLGYDFYTVFDFGEREFETCFEMGDGDRVHDALMAIALAAPDGPVAQGARAMGWTVATPSVNAKNGVDRKAVQTDAPLLGFEVTLPGFDGSTDATDDRILWVLATSEQDVSDVVAGSGCTVLALGIRPSHVVDFEDFDYALPEQEQELRARVASLGNESVLEGPQP